MSSQGADMDRVIRSHAKDGASLSVGVVGLGYWGPNLLRGLMEVPHVDVRYVCDLDGERLSAFARRYPGATPTDDYEELIALASDRDLRLMCGQTFLYSPPVRAIKRLIDTNELGEIFFISSSRVNLGLHQRDVSVIWDLGPHDFSILLHWLDEMPSWVGAVGRDSVVK